LTYLIYNDDNDNIFSFVPISLKLEKVLELISFMIFYFEYICI